MFFVCFLNLQQEGLVLCNASLNLLKVENSRDAESADHYNKKLECGL